MKNTNPNLYDNEYTQNRSDAFERDAFCCRICGMDCEIGGTKRSNGLLECHHVERNLSKDKINKVDNLLSVCWFCHGRLTVQERKWVWGQDAIDVVQLSMEKTD